jgi:hypothetical protein
MTASARPLPRSVFTFSAAPVLDEPAHDLVPPPRPAPVRGAAPAESAEVPRRATGRAPFVVLLLVLMGGGLLCLLLLNTALTERAFVVHELQAQAEQLSEQEQELVVEVDKLSTPEALAAQAAALGMGPGQQPLLLPAGAPLPPGGRVVAREPDSGALLVVVPPAEGTVVPPPEGSGEPSGEPVAP